MQLQSVSNCSQLTGFNMKDNTGLKWVKYLKDITMAALSQNLNN